MTNEETWRADAAELRVWELEQCCAKLNEQCDALRDGLSHILDHSFEGSEKGCLYCGEVNQIASRLLSIAKKLRKP